jgi:hypothetical protein
MASACQQDAVDPFLAQEAQVDGQLLSLVVGIANDEHIAMRAGHVLDTTRQARVVGVGDVGHNQRQRASFTTGQAAGERARSKVELARSGLHTLTHHRPHWVGAAVQDSRDRRYRYAGPSSNVLDRRRRHQPTRSENAFQKALSRATLARGERFSAHAP